MLWVTQRPILGLYGCVPERQVGLRPEKEPDSSAVVDQVELLANEGVANEIRPSEPAEGSHCGERVHVASRSFLNLCFWAYMPPGSLGREGRS